MWPGRAKSEEVQEGEEEAARDRAVRARSWAEMPVDVPAGKGSGVSEGCSRCDMVNGGGRDVRVHTMSVVYSHSVRSPMPFLVLRDHHRDVKLLQPLSR
jgi:hypothetical protein